MANRQFLRRIKASAGRAILILAFMAVLSACGDDDGASDPFPNGSCNDRTNEDGTACTICYGPILKDEDGFSYREMTFSDCDHCTTRPIDCLPP